jgi:ubiquinone/menaquinone biosynthesis C-methylase UbiE
LYHVWLSENKKRLEPSTEKTWSFFSERGVEMSTYVLMKLLESAPSRYDKGIHLLTLGALPKIYDQLVNCVKEGTQALDIGCGTGALTIRAIQRGALVKGIDINPEMLKIAQGKVDAMDLSERVILDEMGVAELDAEESESYDIVMSGLCFSELTEDEQLYALKEIKRILKPGGHFLLADEIKPQGFFKRLIYWIIKMPLVVITYLVSQTITHALNEIIGEIERAGLEIETVTFNKMENFISIIARNPEEKLS